MSGAEIDRIVIAKNTLIEIYDIERALRARIDRLDKSDWGQRLAGLMKTVAADLEPELHKLPNNLHHVLSSRALHHDDTVAGRLNALAWKARDVVIGSALFCRKLITIGTGDRPVRN